MMTFILDTSFDYLVVAVAQDNQLIYNQQLLCPKNQSEQIFVEIERMQSALGINPHDFDEVVVTCGPGSYTGVRIAMTVAKVMASLAKIPLYTISSLHAIIGLNDGLALIDARAKRAYGLEIVNGTPKEERVYFLEELNDYPVEKIYGQVHLVTNLSDRIDSLALNILEIRNFWHLNENIDQVVPVYLKDNNSYATH